MEQGYPFKGTTGTLTVYDPILLATVTTIVIRGDNDYVTINGVSVADDSPTLGNQILVIVGNSEPTYRAVAVNTNRFDADAGTSVGMDLNYTDLGGYKVKEGETITITGPAAGNCAGVLWVEDNEPQIDIPSTEKNRVVCIRYGGTNDAGTAVATTGGDLQSAKLENGYIYTPFMVDVISEDKVCEINCIKAGKDSMTLPPVGRMTYQHAPLQFTGQQFNAGQVLQYLQVQAASKVLSWVYCVEVAGKAPSPNAPPLESVPITRPGAVTLASITASGGSGGGGSGSFGGFNAGAVGNQYSILR